MIRIAAASFALALFAMPVQADDVADPAAQQSAAEDSMLGMLTMKPGADMSEADRGYMKSMQTMQQNVMKTEMSGNASGDFVRMMIPHHQSAIDMIDVLLAQKDVDPDIRKIAEKMRADQAKDIVEMQKWLEAHPR
jgi:uncharacterized protein (DUF305 family)